MSKQIPGLTGRALSNDFSTLSFPLVKEYFRKTGMPQDRKFTQLPDICNQHSREFELRSGRISFCSLASSKRDAPYTKYGPRTHTKYEVLLSAGFPPKACESRRKSKRLSTHLHNQ
jgi:hypothetical protein